MTSALYAPGPAETVERHTFSVLVENEPGVLARVIGLFSGRGYNIESLTVAEVDRVRGLSRINLVTTGSRMIIEQIRNQLDRLVPVHRVRDLTVEGPHLEREIALIKVVGSGEKRVESLRIADIFRAHVVDSTNTSFVFEMTGRPEKVDAFIRLMEPLGLIEISRTGVVAMARGTEGI
jgi:acetolactate synthase-1/3 small subunit